MRSGSTRFSGALLAAAAVLTGGACGSWAPSAAAQDPPAAAVTAAAVDDALAEATLQRQALTTLGWMSEPRPERAEASYLVAAEALAQAEAQVDAALNPSAGTARPGFTERNLLAEARTRLHFERAELARLAQAAGARTDAEAEAGTTIAAAGRSAAATLREAAESEPRAAAYYALHRARALRDRGQAARAAEVLASALVAGGQTEVPELQLDYLEAMGVVDPPRAVSEIEEALQTAADGVVGRLLWLRANALAEAGRSADATDQARDPAVVAAAPPLQRLRLMQASAEMLRKEGVSEEVLELAELLQLARLERAVGRPLAADQALLQAAQQAEPTAPDSEATLTSAEWAQVAALRSEAADPLGSAAAYEAAAAAAAPEGSQQPRLLLAAAHAHATAGDPQAALQRVQVARTEGLPAADAAPLLVYLGQGQPRPTAWLPVVEADAAARTASPELDALSVLARAEAPARLDASDETWRERAALLLEDAAVPASLRASLLTRLVSAAEDPTAAAAWLTHPAAELAEGETRLYLVRRRLALPGGLLPAEARLEAWRTLAEAKAQQAGPAASTVTDELVAAAPGLLSLEGADDVAAFLLSVPAEALTPKLITDAAAELDAASADGGLQTLAAGEGSVAGRARGLLLLAAADAAVADPTEQPGDVTAPVMHQAAFGETLAAAVQQFPGDAVVRLVDAETRVREARSSGDVQAHAAAAVAAARVARSGLAEGGTLWWRATRALASGLELAGEAEEAAHLRRVARTLHPEPADGR